jgi:hypothetical protein
MPSGLLLAAKARQCLDDLVRACHRNDEDEVAFGVPVCHDVSPIGIYGLR